MRGSGLLRGKARPFPGGNGLAATVGIIWEDLSGRRNVGRGGVVSCLPWTDCAVACKAHLAKAGFHFLAVICYIVKYGEKIDLNRIVLNLPLPKNGQKCNCQRQVSILSNP